MLRRILPPVLLAAFIALLTIVTWTALQTQHEEQVAHIAEAESYAARSQLIRNADTLLRALADINDYWLLYGHLPREQWASHAGIELAHFTGIELMVWNDPSRGVRYARTADNPVFDYRPTDEEWKALQRLHSTGQQLQEDEILGPFVDDAGAVTFEIYLAGTDAAAENAYLVALVNASEAFGHWLADVSPGYAISVFWDDVLLHSQGVAAESLPESWTREGMIRTSLGAVWRVLHQPTDELPRAHNDPAMTAVLWAGLAIAILMGLLLFENGRARSRALAAEAAERKIAELNQDLEQQISARVRELADRTADLETITDSVAHDLRNPLNSISVSTQLMQQFESTLGVEGREALQRIATSVKRMSEILDRLLGLSVVSQSIFRRETIDLHEIVVDVFEDLSSSEQPPPVELVADALPEVNADPVLVRTLIMNLVGNAIKFTREKPIRKVEVTFDYRDGVTCYCVKDNGVGFDPESAERMFRAFERLDGNEDTDGVGLGLDIATRVIKRHDGQIWAKGEQGSGAAIFFTLEPPQESGASAP